MKKEMKFSDIYESKAYKVNDLTYPHPKTYLDKFVEIFPKKPTSEIIKIEHPVINVNEDESENVSFPRFLYQRIYKIDNKYDFAPGILVALDLGKPVIKTFFGFNTRACTNMNIFNSQHVSVGFLTDSNHDRVFSDLKTHSDNQAEIVEKYHKVIENMNNKTIKEKDLHTLLGILLIKSLQDKVFGVQAVINAAGYLTDQKNAYYFGKENNINLIYNSLTDTVTQNKNFVNAPNRVLSMYTHLLNSVDQIKN